MLNPWADAWAETLEQVHVLRVHCAGVQKPDGSQPLTSKLQVLNPWRGAPRPKLNQQNTEHDCTDKEQTDLPYNKTKNVTASLRQNALPPNNKVPLSAPTQDHGLVSKAVTKSADGEYKT